MTATITDADTIAALDTLADRAVADGWDGQCHLGKFLIHQLELKHGVTHADEGSNEFIRLWRAICIENSIPLAAAAEASRLMVAPPPKRPWRGWPLVIIVVVVLVVAGAALWASRARGALTEDGAPVHEVSDYRWLTPLTALDDTPGPLTDEIVDAFVAAVIAASYARERP